MTAACCDCDHAHLPLVSAFQNPWNDTWLTRFIVGRGLTCHSTRSAFSVWWTSLNPLLTIGVARIAFDKPLPTRVRNEWFHGPV